MRKKVKGASQNPVQGRRKRRRPMQRHAGECAAATFAAGLPGVAEKAETGAFKRAVALGFPIMPLRGNTAAITMPPT